MSREKARQSLENLNKALIRLEQALNESDKNSLYIDGTLHRFEFSIELFWKTLKRLLELEGIETMTPKETLKKAYASHWLSSEIKWLQMLQDRNETSHVYDEEKAKEIYRHVKNNFSELRKTCDFLNKKFKNLNDKAS